MLVLVRVLIYNSTSVTVCLLAVEILNLVSSSRATKFSQSDPQRDMYLALWSIVLNLVAHTSTINSYYM